MCRKSNLGGVEDGKAYFDTYYFKTFEVVFLLITDQFWILLTFINYFGFNAKIGVGINFQNKK